MDTKNTRRGFTLLELLVVVLIIGVLAAVAVPQYQRAVLKSRFTALMPIGKTLANANEAYYLQHLEYASAPADLPVEGQAQYPDGTSVLLYPGTEDLSFVRVKNETSVPNAQYVVYQKHSKNFPDTTWCEAGDTRAEAICAALGGVLPNGLTGNSSGTDGWKAYLLSGQVREGDTFAAASSGCSGEKPANITASVSGATGTASCVNGKWVYAWTGGDTYEEEPCTGDSAYACAGATFESYSLCDGESAYACVGSTFRETTGCYGGAENACSGSTFSGPGSGCDGYAENACADSTYSGEDGGCYGGAENACGNSIFSGNQSFCQGDVENVCKGSTIQAGAYCEANQSGGCDGVLYGAHPDKNSSLLGSCNDYQGYCPTGVPLMGGWNETTQAYDLSGWKGNCCNPTYMISGECPSGITVCPQEP